MSYPYTRDWELDDSFSIDQVEHWGHEVSKYYGSPTVISFEKVLYKRYISDIDRNLEDLEQRIIDKFMKDHNIINDKMFFTS